MDKKQISILNLKKMKQEKQPITMLTAYDYIMASILDEAGVDIILVGDSLGNVVLGYESTVPVKLSDMLHHVKAVARGVKRALVVADMPFLTYHLSLKDTLENAGKLIQDGGAKAVKVEGGSQIIEDVRALVNAGIPVMGHLGLTPQFIYQIGSYKIQADTEQEAQQLMEDAVKLQEAGVFAIVLECVPAELAAKVTDMLDIPTIGIGAGVNCDGQVLVTHDLLGFKAGFKPKFVKQYANLHEEMMKAVKSYCNEVRERKFPAKEHSF